MWTKAQNKVRTFLLFAINSLVFSAVPISFCSACFAFNECTYQPNQSKLTHASLLNFFIQQTPSPSSSTWITNDDNMEGTKQISERRTPSSVFVVPQRKFSELTLFVPHHFWLRAALLCRLRSNQNDFCNDIIPGHRCSTTLSGWRFLWRIRLPSWFGSLHFDAASFGIRISRRPILPRYIMARRLHWNDMLN